MVTRIRCVTPRRPLPGRFRRRQQPWWTATSSATRIAGLSIGWPVVPPCTCPPGQPRDIYGAVYRIGAGAPVYVSTWAAFGGVQPATNVDEAAIDLAGSGWYSHLLYRPADGTFVRGSTTGAVYRMAGGAPVYVSTWAAFGGVQPATTIDEAAIDLIGSSDYYDHIAAKPVDGTFLRGTSTGAVYRIVGGAPVYVSTWAAFGGLQPATNVDEAAIDLAGSGWYTHLSFYPADGTFLQGLPGGQIYRIASG